MAGVAGARRPPAGPAAAPRNGDAGNCRCRPEASLFCFQAAVATAAVIGIIFVAHDGDLTSHSHCGDIKLSGFERFVTPPCLIGPSHEWRPIHIPRRCSR